LERLDGVRAPKARAQIFGRRVTCTDAFQRKTTGTKGRGIASGNSFYWEVLTISTTDQVQEGSLERTGAPFSAINSDFVQLSTGGEQRRAKTVVYLLTTPLTYVLSRSNHPRRIGSMARARCTGRWMMVKSWDDGRVSNHARYVDRDALLERQTNSVSALLDACLR
jgi:hypothetical protein